MVEQEKAADAAQEVMEQEKAQMAETAQAKQTGPASFDFIANSVN